MAGRQGESASSILVFRSSAKYKMSEVLAIRRSSPLAGPLQIF